MQSPMQDKDEENWMTKINRIRWENKLNGFQAKMADEWINE